MNFIRFTVTTVSLLAISGAALAQSAAPLTKADVAAIVKETIMNDPQIIADAIDKWRSQKAEQDQKAASEALKNLSDAMLKDPNMPSYGASIKDADVTIAEFFDYHCGYCKHFLPELSKPIESDKKVRVVFIDFPILSEDSKTAAKAAIAVNNIDKGKYFEFHSALMKESGKFDEAKLLEIGKRVGIKSDQLKAEMAKPEVEAELKKHREWADKLNISGTPAIIVGKQVVPGATSAEELKKMVANARAGK